MLRRYECYNCGKVFTVEEDEEWHTLAVCPKCGTVKLKI